METGMDLKVRRIRLRLTQDQVAKRLGVSRSWVARAEGDNPPSSDALQRLDAALRTFGDVSEAA